MKRLRITRWIIFCIKYSRLLSVYYKKYDMVTDNPPILIHVNKLKNRITFNIKKLFSRTKCKITKGKMVKIGLF